MKKVKFISCLCAFFSLCSLLALNAQTTQTFRVLDVDNELRPVSGVSVKCYGAEITFSDNNGICKIVYKNKKTGDLISLRSVEKEGYHFINYDFESTGIIDPNKEWNIYVSNKQKNLERQSKVFKSTLDNTYKDYVKDLSEYRDSLKNNHLWYSGYLNIMDFNILNAVNQIRNNSLEVIESYGCENGEIADKAFNYLLNNDINNFIKILEDADLVNKVKLETNPKKKKELLNTIILYLNSKDLLYSYPKQNELKPYYETLISNNYSINYTTRSYIYYLTSINQIDSAIDLTESSIKKVQTKTNEARLKGILASIYLYNKNDLKKAKKLYNEVIEVYKEINISEDNYYQDLLSNAYLNMSYLFKSSNQLEQALEYLKLALEANNQYKYYDNLSNNTSRAQLHKELSEIYFQLENIEQEHKEHQNYFNYIENAYKEFPQAFAIDYIVGKKQLVFDDIDNDKYDFTKLDEIIKAEQSLTSEYPLFFNSRLTRTRINLLYGKLAQIKSFIKDESEKEEKISGYKAQKPDYSEIKSIIDSCDKDFSILELGEPIAFNNYYLSISDAKLTYSSMNEDSILYINTINNIINLCRNSIKYDTLYYLKNLANYSYKYASYLSHYNDKENIEKYYSLSLESIKSMMQRGDYYYKGAFGDISNKLADAYFVQDKDEPALKSFQETIDWYNKLNAQEKKEADADYINAIYSSGYTLRHIKQFDKAIKVYNNALELISDRAKKDSLRIYNVANTQTELALCYYGLDNKQKCKEYLIGAVENYGKVVKGFTNEKYLNAVNYLKQVSEETKDWNLFEQTSIKKVNILREFSQYDTNNYIIPYANEYLDLAKLHNDMNKIDLAQKEYKDVVDIYRLVNKSEPKNFRRKLVVALYYQGCNLMDKEIYYEAINSFNEANSINNELMVEDSAEHIYLKEEIANKLGLSYYLDKNNEEDLESVRMAKSTFMESLRIREYMYATEGDKLLNNLGYTNRVIGDLNRELELYLASEESYLEAKKYYQKFFTANKNEAEVQYFRTVYALGDLYQSNLDRAKDAEKLYRESLEVYNNMDNQNKLEVQKAYYYLLNDLITVIQESKLDSSDLEKLIKLRDSTKKELEKKS